MITGIREKTIVGEGGKIEILSPDLPIGTEVEVIVLVEEEQDTTEYLLSTEANSKYMEEALEELKHPERFIPVDIENL
jgi:antitoxin YefM